MRKSFTGLHILTQLNRNPPRYCWRHGSCEVCGDDSVELNLAHLPACGSNGTTLAKEHARLWAPNQAKPIMIWVMPAKIEHSEPHTIENESKSEGIVTCFGQGAALEHGQGLH